MTGIHDAVDPRGPASTRRGGSRWTRNPFDLEDDEFGTPAAIRVVVGVVDEGVDTTLAYFRKRLAVQVNKTTGSFAPRMPSHGNKCASVATWGSSKLHLRSFKTRHQAAAGSLGAAESSVEVPLIKACFQQLSSYDVQVVSFSIGAGGAPGKRDYAGVREVVAAHENVLFVFGAGNQDSNLDDKGIWEPASSCYDLPNVIVVGGCDNLFSRKTRDVLGGTVNFGYGQTTVHINNYANFVDGDDGLGVNVLDPGTWHSYDSASLAEQATQDTGVSFAIPQVANVAAKMLLLNPSLTPGAIKKVVMDTATVNEKLAKLSVTGGVLNPAGCYAAAR